MEHDFITRAIERNRSWCDAELVMMVDQNKSTTPMGWKSKKAFYYCIDEDYEGLHLPFMKRYQEWYAGMTRVTYVDTDMVYKVPLNPEGDEANEFENAVSNALGYHDGEWYAQCLEIPVARCYLEGSGTLVMERVEPITFPEDFHSPQMECGDEECIEYAKRYPDWVWLADGGQVGYTRSGNLVAYDL